MIFWNIKIGHYYIKDDVSKSSAERGALSRA